MTCQEADQEVQRGATMVSLAKRRRVMAERAEVQRKEDQRARAVKEDAARALARSQNAIGAVDCLEPYNGPLPFQVHQSHKAFYVGGYATCMVCAATESCAAMDNRLPRPCLGVAPEGSLSRPRRLLKGRHPRKVGQH